MQIIDSNVSTLEKIRKESEVSQRPIDDLIVIKYGESTALLKIYNGIYIDYFTRSRVLFYENIVDRVCLITQYTEKDIETREILNLPKGRIYG